MTKTSKRDTRKPMNPEEFAKYREGFTKTRKALGDTLQDVKYRTAMGVRENKYYMFRGVILYVDNINEDIGKLHVVYEDGTHLTKLIESFIRSMHMGGSVINPKDRSILEELGI